MSKERSGKARKSEPEAVVAATTEAVRPDFYEAVADVLRSARSKAYRAVDFIMVEAYWTIGRMIVEEEQQGRQRAEYGAFIVRNLSSRLTGEFGKGFSEQSLRNIRQFFVRFAIRSALRSELSWTHYKILIRVADEKPRAWYVTEAADQNWSTRALERQINSLYYERLLASRDKAPVVDEMKEKTAPLAPSPRDFIKDPYVLEFLGLQDNPAFRESDLEAAIVGKLQAFLLELGKGFAFVARQQRVSTETKDFFEIGDYVIVHELLHFSVPNHGRLWKSLMRAHLGEYEKYADELARLARGASRARPAEARRHPG